jgi:hypothetical protein
VLAWVVAVVRVLVRVLAWVVVAVEAVAPAFEQQALVAVGILLPLGPAGGLAQRVPKPLADHISTRSRRPASPTPWL